MELSRALGRVRHRVRLGRALTGLGWGFLAGAVLAPAYWFIADYRGVEARLVWIAAALVAPMVLGAIGWSLIALSDLASARLADRALHLHDRLTAALEFAALQNKSALMLAAIEDAERLAPSVDAKRVVVLRAPRIGKQALLIVLTVFFLALVRSPGQSPQAMPIPPQAPRFSVANAVLAPEQKAAEEFRRQADRIGDPQLQKLSEDLNRLVKDLGEANLSRSEAFEKLSVIERKLGNPSQKELENVRAGLQKAGRELERSKFLANAAKALAEEDLDKAKQELEKLAKAAEKREEDLKQAESAKDENKARELRRDIDKQRQELQQAFDKAAKELQKEIDRQQQKEEQKLKDEERRLKKELEKDPQNEELQRQLKKNQRELERLEREKQEQRQAERQLQRLQREMQDTAEQMRQKMTPQQLKQMAEQMQQMQQQLQKMGQLQKVQVYVGELKEMMRRSGQGQGEGQNGQPQPGQEQSGQGKRGDGKNGQGGLLDDFNQRAGQDGPKVLILDPSKPGSTPVLMPGMGQQGPGQGQGDQKGGGDEPGNDPGGKGIGDQHDPNLRGAASRLDAKTTATQVKGSEGSGPSRSETISAAAQKGFASRAYKKVYGDYSSLAEESMTKEAVPSGYRYFVKRYFQLIKPRE